MTLASLPLVASMIPSPVLASSPELVPAPSRQCRVVRRFESEIHQVKQRPFPEGFAAHAFIAEGEIHTVMSPRWTRARSYSAQLVTRYFVLYFGWTLEFMPEPTPD